MRSRFLVVVAILATWAFSCKNKAPTAPEAQYQEAKSFRKTSYLSTDLVIGVDKLEDFVEKKTAGPLYEDQSFDNNKGDNLKLKAQRKGEVQIQSRNQYISYTFPIEVSGTYRASTGSFFGVAASKEVPFRFSAKFRFATSINISNNWDLVTKTTPNGYEWIDKPSLSVLGVNIPLATLAEPIFDRQQEKIAELLDKEVRKAVDLKSMIGPVWKTIQQAIQLNEEPPAFLYIIPQNFYHSGLLGNRREIRLRTAIEAELLTQTHKETNLAAKPLPFPQNKSHLHDTFSLYLNALVGYEEAEGIAKKFLLGKTFNSKNGKKNVKVEDLRLYPKGGSLLVGLKTSGDVEGELFLSGVPYYDPQSQELALRDVAWESKTSSFLLNSADWLAGKVVAKLVEKKLRISLSEQLQDAKTMAQQQVNAFRPNDFTRLQLSLVDLQPSELHLVRKGILAQVYAKGKLVVDLDLDKLK